MDVYVADWWLPSILAVLGIAIVWRLHRRSLAGPTRGWRRFYFGLRVLVVLLLCAALADIQARRTGDERAVIAIVDKSRSVPTRLREAAEQWLRRQTASLSPRDRFGVVVAARAASIEFTPTATPPDRSFQSVVDPDGTDLAKAIDSALAAFPEGAAKRILLVSDGNQTAGDALAAARRAKAAGAHIDVLPVRYSHAAEVSVERIDVPVRVDEDKPLELRIRLQSTIETEGTLTLRHNGRLIPIAGGGKVSLKPGPNVFPIPYELKSGFHTFEASIDCPDDTLVPNNRGFGFTQVQGQPRVLLVEADPSHAAALKRAAEAEGLAIELVDVAGLPVNVGELQNYDCCILSNVPASALSLEQMALIQGAVRDLGMGLIMIGGENSFASGGYLATPIEETLPVDMEIRQKRVLPNGALALIMHTCEFPDGNNWARQITKEAIRVLGAHDYVGVLYFGGMGGYNWLTNGMEKVGGNKGSLLAKVDNMNPGDMPDFDTTMNMAHQGLMKTNAAMRHIVIVSDGDASPPQPNLVAQIQKAGISVSGIEIFPHGGTGTLQRLAQQTKGNFYPLSQPGDEKKLPRLLAKEALTVKRSLLSEQTFTPSPGNPSEVLRGIDVRTLPPLHGYVISSPKPEAFVPLRGPEDDPILAHWRYGLGASLAWTSDAKNRWAANWLAWPNFSKFWSQAIRWTSRSIPKSNFRMTIQPDGSKARVLVDALDDQGKFVNDLRVLGRGLAPEGGSIQQEFRQTAAGRYETEIDLDEVGVYMLNAVYEGPGGQKGRLVGGLAVNYSPEYEHKNADLALLGQIRQLTGGRELPALMQAADGSVRAPLDPLFVEEERVFGAAWPLWPLLLTLAVLLFLLDVTFRRVQMDLRPVRRAMAGAFARVPGLRGLAARLTPRRRVGETVGVEVSGTAPAPAGPLPTWTPDLTQADAAPHAGGGAPTAAPDAPAPAADPGDEPGGIYTRRLLDAKKRALPKKRGET